MRHKFRAVAWVTLSGVKGVTIRIDTTSRRSSFYGCTTVYFWRLEEADDQSMIGTSWPVEPLGFSSRDEALASAR